MKAKILFGIALAIIWMAQPVSSAALEVLNAHPDPKGGISVVIKTALETPLKAEYFHLLEDDTFTAAASKIASIQSSHWKLLLVLCVDTSGSMAQEPLKAIRSALKAIMASNIFRDIDRIALIAFENEHRIIQFFEQPEKTINHVDDLVWLGKYKTVSKTEDKTVFKTALYQTMYEMLDHFEKLKPVPPELRHILVISDGKDEGSKVSLKEVTEKAINLGIPIHAVAHIRQDLVKEFRLEGFAQNMHALAAQTGGRFEHTESDGVRDAIDRVLQKIMTTPVVYFERSTVDSGTRTKTVGVQLQLPDGSSMRDSIPMEIPKTLKEVSSPEDHSRFGYFWRLFGGILIIVLIGLIAILYSRTRKKEQITEKQIPDNEPPEPEFSEPRQVSPRLTQVGGYNFHIPSAQNPTAVLVGVSGPLEGQRFPVEKDMFYMGADAENDLSIPEDDYVSGSHAYLQYEQGNLYLFDLESQNGTFVNEEPVTGKGVSLVLGDRIRMGISSFDLTKVSQ